MIKNNDFEVVDQGTRVPGPGDEFTVFVHCPLSSENKLETVLGQKKLDSGQWTVELIVDSQQWGVLNSRQNFV